MKISFLILFFSPLLALGIPSSPEPGTYFFRDPLELVQKKRIEVVYGATQNGRHRLLELKKQGHVCKLVQRETFRCVGFMPLVLDRDTELKAKALIEKNHLVFGKPEGNPSLISRGDAYEEWLFPQAVSFLGIEYPHHRVGISSGIQKINLGYPARYALLFNHRGFLHPYEMAVQENKEVVTVYSFVALFSL